MESQIVSLISWRRSKASRIAAIIVLLNFLTSQNLYGQEFHVQEGTRLYTPVAEAVDKRAEKGVAKTSLKVFVASTPYAVALTPQNQIFFKIPVEGGNQLPYFETEMNESYYTKMENYNKPKSIAKDYAPSPFYFREQRDRDETRLVVWSPDLNQMKEFFYQALRIFPEEVEVLLKIEREDKSEEERWDRYYGRLRRSKLEEKVKYSEELIFQDGNIQLNVRRQDTGEYITFDEHGIFYVYSKSEQLEELCRENGFENRLEKLISDIGHWHITPKEAQKKGPSSLGT